MADKSKGNANDKRDKKGGTRRDAVKDLPVRSAKAENVKGGVEPINDGALGKKGPLRAEPVNG